MMFSGRELREEARKLFREAQGKACVKAVQDSGDPEAAERLLTLAQKAVNERWQKYEQMASMG